MIFLVWTVRPGLADNADMSRAFPESLRALSKVMTKPADAETLARRRSALQIAGLVLLASWLFVLVALVGYSPADPPTHSVYPPNPVAENPLGQAGAGVASLVFKTLGYPAWVLLIGTLFFLVIPVFRVKVTFPILRAVGLVMLVAGL